ncbi:helix-turn-helix domain-containing protein [bacterium]|nr:helix-turn-helix domain-containing protein [bacterium]
MAQIFLTIQESADLTKKSVQTIRRAIRSKKIKSRKKKTPQGYNYMLDKDSLIKTYGLEKANDEVVAEKKKSGAKISKNAKKIAKQYLTRDDLGIFKETVQNLIEQNEKDKENFFRLIKTFQDRVVVLENQVKLLAQPKKKWYQIWK